MRRIGSFFFLAYLFTLCSCKKEYSCENCGNNTAPGPAGANKAPLANAGPDRIITLPTDSTLIDGSLSSDRDGSISSWSWTKITGPVSFQIGNPVLPLTGVRYLVAGVYQFELLITDNKGASARDTMKVTVGSPGTPNRPPVARAGPDQAITLPVNSINLDGSASSDPDNNITGYSWTKISGPASFAIANANAVQTGVVNLTAGTYRFELKVTDADRLFSMDTLQVSVTDPGPPCTDCQIVFVSDRDGDYEIYSCNADGSNIRRLTNDNGHDYHPAWSPDGSRIAFISDRTGNPELYIMNSDGSNPVRKTFDAGYADYPAWSPDGKKIVYAAVNNDGSTNIWLIDVVSGSSNMLFTAPGWDSQPAWSPDGTKIALVSDWMAYDFVWDIYTINADGSGFTVLTGNIFDHFDYLYPSWSPNGSKIAMAISQTTGIDQYSTRIGIMNPNGTALTAIVAGAAPWSRTSWSGDGSKILYTSLSGSRKDITWVFSNGSSGTTIVINGWDADWKH